MILNIIHVELSLNVSHQCLKHLNIKLNAMCQLFVLISIPNFLIKQKWAGTIGFVYFDDTKFYPQLYLYLYVKEDVIKRLFEFDPITLF